MNNDRKLIFRQRVPEPRAMRKVEQRTFEKFSLESYKRWFMPLVDDIMERTNLESERVLDIGCGPGLLEKEISARSKKIRVVGVDVSSYVLGLARKNCKSLANVNFQKGSVYKLPFANEMFDIVICKDSFHHFDEAEKALSEMWRVLRQGGTLYIQDLRRDLPHYLLKRAVPPETIFQKLQFYSARAAYTKKEIEKLFRKLKVIFYHIKTRKLTLPLIKRYTKEGIDIPKLRESFQARYIAVARKI